MASSAYRPGMLPEIVRRRADGLWYSERRLTDVQELAGMKNWLISQDSALVRWVEPSEPLLSASYYWMEQKGRPTGAPIMMGVTAKMPEYMTEDKARLQGSQLAQAMCEAFTPNPSVQPGTVYALARTLANLSDKFRDGVDVYEAFTAGFLTGWKQQAPRIAAPADSD